MAHYSEDWKDKRVIGATRSGGKTFLVIDSIENGRLFAKPARKPTTWPVKLAVALFALGLALIVYGAAL